MQISECRISRIDTNFNEFLADISGLVYEGQNVVTIVPETAFEMVILDVFIS